MESVVQTQPWKRDPPTVPKPWSDEEYRLINHGGGKKLCFGIMWDDGVIVPHPPIIRGLEIVKQALLKAGHSGDSLLHEDLYNTNTSFSR